MARMKRAVLCLLAAFCGMAAAQTVAPVRVVPAAVQLMVEEVEGYGVVQAAPAGNIAIAAATPMRIDRIRVGPGDVVEKDQLLVELQRDPSLDVEVEKARIQLAQNEVELARAERLFKSGVIPKAQLEQAQVERDLAKADFELQSRSLQFAVENSRIRAPIRETVSRVSGVIGQIADPAQEILHLVDAGAIVARIGVELEDAGKVAVGQAAAVDVPNLPGGASFAGRVAKLNREVDPATQLMYIWIELDNREGRLQPGMFAVGRISVRTVSDALVVPRSAVLKDEQGSYVFVVAEGAAHRVAVKTGIQTDAEVQILDGIGADQEVVAAGNYELEEGMPVDIQAGR